MKRYYIAAIVVGLIFGGLGAIGGVHNPVDVSEIEANIEELDEKKIDTNDTRQVVLTNENNQVATPFEYITGDPTNNPNLVSTFIEDTEKASANGVATLDGAGKVPGSQIPAIAITEVYVVSNYAERDALLPVGTGDVCIVTASNKNFIASTSTNWTELLDPGEGVTSVNGDSGPNVTLDTDDIAEATTNKYYTEARVQANPTVGSNSTHRTTTSGNPHSVTKEEIGVTNLSDLVNDPGFAPSNTIKVIAGTNTTVQTNGTEFTINASGSGGAVNYSLTVTNGQWDANGIVSVPHNLASDATIVQFWLDGESAIVPFTNVSINEIEMDASSLTSSWGSLEGLVVVDAGATGGNTNASAWSSFPATNDITSSGSNQWDIGSPSLPFKDAYLGTIAQGVWSGTAIDLSNQDNSSSAFSSTGDNVSIFVNDAGFIIQSDVPTDTTVGSNSTHRTTVSGNPHQVGATEITDFDTEVQNNPTVGSNSTHRTTTSGNPHQVTAADIGAVTNETVVIAGTKIAVSTNSTGGTNAFTVNYDPGTNFGRMTMVIHSSDSPPTEAFSGYWDTWEFKDLDGDYAWIGDMWPIDGDSGYDPEVRIATKINIAGSATGSVIWQVRARYVSDGEYSTNAVDQTINITNDLPVNVLHWITNVQFTLDSSLISSNDIVQLELERIGGTDTFDGRIGIMKEGRLVYKKSE